MPMTLLMWILLSGSILGLLIMGVCAIARKLAGVRIGLVVCIVFTISFGVYALSELHKNSPADDCEEIGNATFEEIYTTYKENELVGDDLYKNNRYLVTAKINGISTGGLLHSSDCATLTLEKRVGNTIVFFYAEFGKDQGEALKMVKVGDTITFEGECLNAGTWVNCKIAEGE